MQRSRKICVSVYGRTVSDLLSNLETASSFDPLLIEVRLDYIHSFHRDILDLGERIRDCRNLIVTFRSPREGGVARVSDETHKQVLLEIIAKISPPLIDIELSTLDKFPEILESLNRTSSSRSKLIISSHDFQKTEDTNKIEVMIRRAALRYSPFAVKIVRKANDFADNLRILSLYRIVENISPTLLVAFCVGPLGTFSRVACVSCGSPFTFASLPNQRTAPGQLDVGSMDVLLDSWQ